MNRDHQKRYYGWYILAACFFILFCSSGARYIIGVMFKPMIAEFGWDRGSLSLVYFLHMTVFALSLTLVGQFYDRYGPRWVILISSLLLALGSFSIAAIQNLWQLYFCYGILSALGISGASVPLVGALLSKWFVKRRGFAISLAVAGNGIGHFALVPLFTLFVIKFDWRVTYLFLGLMVLLVNAPLALFIFKRNPDDVELKAVNGNGEKNGHEDLGQMPEETITRDMNLREAMGTGSFWFFLIMLFICGSGDFLVSTHLIPMVTDYGISPAVGGSMLAWLGLMSLFGVLIAGPAADRIGNKTPIAITFIIRFFLFLLVLKYQTVLSFYIFSLLFGLTFLVTAPLTVTTAGKLYGLSHLGIIAGFVSTIHHMAGGFWAYVGGLTFDSTGSYRLIFILSAIMSLIAVISTLLIKEKRHVPKGL